MSAKYSLACIIISVIVLIAGAATAAEHWVACGDDQLVFYEMLDDSMKESGRVTWADLVVPDTFTDVRNMNGIVECKPVNNGKELLITSWHGGVAKLDIATRTVNFSAHVPHAHSAALLPGNRIIAVGNYLSIFDESDGKIPLLSFRLNDGHGVVWEEKINTLYVLSEEHIEEFKLGNWDTSAPGLKSVRKTQLSGQSDGHDLFMSPQGVLLVSTRDGVWRFDPDAREFAAQPDMNPLLRPQSIAEIGTTLVWVQAEQNWWGHGFFVKTDDKPVKRYETPGIRLYKVRALQ